jgi:hypothetical protein
MPHGLGRKLINGVRLAPGTRVNGHWVEGAETPFTFYASKQPTSAHQLQSLEEGRRMKKSYTLFTSTKLNAMLPSNSNPDKVTIDGEVYEVVSEAPWQNGLINHYMYIVQFINRVS